MHTNRLTALLLPLALCVSCSGGGSSNSESDTTREFLGIDNGFHFVRSTGFNEFDEIVSTWEREVNFDINRMDSVFTSFDTSSEFPGDSIIFESREFFDELGRLTRSEAPGDGVFSTTEYEFNDLGLLSMLTRTGDRTENTELQYNESGQLVLKNRVQTSVFENFPTPITATTTTTTTYTYDSSGQLNEATAISELSDSTTAPGETSTETTTSVFFYGQDDQIIRVERTRLPGTGFGSSGPTSETSTYEYDLNGNMIQETYSSDNFFQRTTYEYEPNEKPLFNLWLRRFRYFPR